MPQLLPNATALVLCGLCARSNMGPDRPTSEDVAWAKSAKITTAQTSATFFCRSFVESAADEAMFAAEAEAWLKQLCRLTLGELRKSWPGVLELYERR
jgi:hypothetical protein